MNEIAASVRLLLSAWRGEPGIALLAGRFPFTRLDISQVSGL